MGLEKQEQYGLIVAKKLLFNQKRNWRKKKRFLLLCIGWKKHAGKVVRQFGCFRCFQLHAQRINKVGTKMVKAREEDNRSYHARNGTHVQRQYERGRPFRSICGQLSHKNKKQEMVVAIFLMVQSTLVW